MLHNILGYAESLSSLQNRLQEAFLALTILPMQKHAIWFSFPAPKMSFLSKVVATTKACAYLPIIFF